LVDGKSLLKDSEWTVERFQELSIEIREPTVKKVMYDSTLMARFILLFYGIGVFLFKGEWYL